MSGATVPYHLRTNKFVERQLFLDLIDFVRIWNGPSRYAYVSMGGKFLEDFKLIHERFGIDLMFSIESDPTTFNRQKFNQPLGFVTCHPWRSDRLVDEFDAMVSEHEERRFIVWLDFAAANARPEQLRQFQVMTSKLRPGDVCKVTLNANPESGGKRLDYGSDEEYQAAMLAWLGEQVGEFVADQDLTNPDFLQSKKFASLLASAVGTAAQRAANEALHLRAVPLGCYRYIDDRHYMLTATAVIADDDLAARIDADATFTTWPFRASDWGEFQDVSVPDLSQRERDYIDALISGNADIGTIHTGLPFRLDRREPKSLEFLESYVKHYRRYPRFGRVNV